MNKYYYLISSLPFLEFKQELPFSRQAFLTEAEKWLKPGDFARLKSADIYNLDASRKDLAIVKEYKLFELVLRQRVSEVRIARKSGVEKKPSALVKAVFEQKDPLAMEIALMKIRWDFLDEKQKFYFFDLNWLVIYFLKLQVLERWTGFDKQKGIEVFDKLCEVAHG